MTVVKEGGGRVWQLFNMAFLAKTSASRDVMAREKRPLDQRDGMPEEKRQRPALARYLDQLIIKHFLTLLMITPCVLHT